MYWWPLNILYCAPGQDFLYAYLDPDPVPQINGDLCWSQYGSETLHPRAVFKYLRAPASLCAPVYILGLVLVPLLASVYIAALGLFSKLSFDIFQPNVKDFCLAWQG